MEFGDVQPRDMSCIQGKVCMAYVHGRWRPHDDYYDY